MKTKLLIGAYALVAIVTFGHAFNSDMDGDKIIGSTGCAIFWPLYWSTQAWGN